ncbi:MAG: hypothetical protein ACOCXJ_01180 [Planctomycetota bacterium]
MLEAIRSVLSDPLFLIIWGIQAAIAVAIPVWDMARNNRHLSR